MTHEVTRRLSAHRIVVICPFWGVHGNAGLPRVERFVRWLAEAGAFVFVVRAGAASKITKYEWGTEVVVWDRLGLYREQAMVGAGRARKPNALRRRVSYQIFNPDPTVVWARGLARNAELVRRLEGATHVLASSPPESVHVGAAALARRLCAFFLMDMRDGWLDEPLRPLLRSSALRRWREARLERRCVARARAVLVTSETWKELLTQRYPDAVPKVHVITNAYPALASYDLSRRSHGQRPGLRLVHAGRFFGSDPRRNPTALLEPLLDVLQRRGGAGEVLLPGAHDARDLEAIQQLRRCLPSGWTLEPMTPIPRGDLLRLLAEASGLLMLTASRSQIPAKLFEYLPTGRPILTVAPDGSEVSRFCRDLPQVFTIPPTPDTATPSRVEAFLDACADPTRRPVPPDYSQEVLGRRFLEIIAN